jgi:hypothetical protein
MSERKEKFTPGPWRKGTDGIRIMCTGETANGWGKSVATADKKTWMTWDEQEGNYNLIAAAPDMYAALEKAVSDYGNNGGPWNVPMEPGTWIEMAQSALAKARGES